MILRFEAEECCGYSKRDDGDLVWYDDHAAEMREVLVVLNEFAMGGLNGKPDVTTWSKFLCIADEYAHYLEEK